MLPKPYYETELGKLYLGDCLQIMPHLEPVDLVLTSPPYDQIRKYDGYTFNFYKTAYVVRQKLVYGGVCVWVVSDQTVDGSETGSSFRQALFFKAIGLNLHDTMFFRKNPIPRTHNRYEQAIEYMFVLSNGKPKTFNPLKERSLHGGELCQSSTTRKDMNNITAWSGNGKKIGEYKIKDNVWFYNTGYNKTTNYKIAFQHPAIFPTLLAVDHIMSWTNEKDTVLDPFCGSGTTAVACERLNRKWIGIEISEKYCEIAAKRIENERKQLKLF